MLFCANTSLHKTHSSFPPFVVNIRKNIFYVGNVVPAFSHGHSHMKTNRGVSSICEMAGVN